eukprot:1141245-Pelagomonas_calceolata.AAC.8
MKVQSGVSSSPVSKCVSAGTGTKGATGRDLTVHINAQANNSHASPVFLFFLSYVLHLLARRASDTASAAAPQGKVTAAVLMNKGQQLMD